MQLYPGWSAHKTILLPPTEHFLNYIIFILLLGLQGMSDPHAGQQYTTYRTFSELYHKHFTFRPARSVRSTCSCILAGQHAIHMIAILSQPTEYFLNHIIYILLSGPQGMSDPHAGQQYTTYRTFSELYYKHFTFRPARSVRSTCSCILAGQHATTMPKARKCAQIQFS